MKSLFAIVMALGLAGCSALSAFNPLAGHPSLAMNPAICGPMGAAVGQLMGATAYSSALDFMLIAMAGCNAEASMTNGPPATTTTTTTSTTSQSKS